MSTTELNRTVPSPDRAQELREEGRAPRYDLEVPRRCCDETLRELVRRRWKKAEIADYCRVEENAIQRKIAHMNIEISGACGPSSDTEVLWYTHPGDLQKIVGDQR